MYCDEQNALTSVTEKWEEKKWTISDRQIISLLYSLFYKFNLENVTASSGFLFFIYDRILTIRIAVLYAL